MSKTTISFIEDYKRFQRIVNEYNTSFQYCIGQMNTKEGVDRQKLLEKLQTVEITDQQQKAILRQRVREQLNELRTLLNMVCRQEQQISERGFERYKSRRDEYGGCTVNQDGLTHTRQDINQQVGNTIKSIEKITQSKMPKPLAAICGFFNKGFRKDAYKTIVDNRQKLENMITAAERDFNIASAELRQEIGQNTARKVAEIQVEKHQLEVSRSTEKNSFLVQLKGLLLDGLEQIFKTDTAYSSAYTHITSYLSSYSSEDSQNLSLADSLLIGIVNQQLSTMDDGTLDHFLASILNDGVYSRGSILLPVALEKYLQKSIYVSYYSDYNRELYSFFSNLALQMMNLFADVGVTTYLVDCTNMGSKYSEFTAFENIDENKRVNIIRTVDELKKLIDELSEYIIETNSAYLKSDFRDVETYNDASVIKREIRALFISNISEVSTMEMLNKLVSIARNGCRCGVMSFFGVSTDECQVSSLTTQNRVNVVNLLSELCDRVYLSSDGNLSFGNGLPSFTAPPEVNPILKQTIIQNAVQNKGDLSIIPLEDHMLSHELYFSCDCTENIIIPIGVDAQGNEYSITLSKDAAYMLIGGNPSCGKSSLIHTIILQCITRYSPDNLELYVADLKDGSEFDIYVKDGIKSVKVVLDDSEQDIAASFLNYIKSNVELRLQKFGELAQLSGKIVRNIEQFYSVNNEQHLVPHLPRMLLIIDEFQSLYNSSRVTGEITNWLVRMCRTVGIYIIMASQRVQADTAAVSNSFGSQTKEYFIYRAMFKLPYSGAKEIMSEHCSDTNRENPAIRKAQTLKSGQIIINPNMGATEEDNQLIQCYYPKNEVITSICGEIISTQGRKAGIIMNSEGATDYSTCVRDTKQILLGDSNRLYFDECNKNNDDIIDNCSVALKSSVNRLIVCGSDTRVHTSVLMSIAAHIKAENAQSMKINILSSQSSFDRLIPDGSFRDVINFTSSADEFLSFADEHNSNDNNMLSILVNPYELPELHKDDYSRASETVDRILKMMGWKSSFMLVLCESIKKLKNDCSYFEQEIPCRVISVGNLSGIRAAMTMDAGEKIVETPFNTVRPNIIKAYYYNKTSDKLGRFRLYNPEDIIEKIDFSAIDHESVKTPLAGYAGLTGN